MSDFACETPLIQLLRKAPRDARGVYENNPTDYSFIPYGIYCHRAADRIEELEARVEGLQDRHDRFRAAIQELADNIPLAADASEGRIRDALEEYQP